MCSYSSMDGVLYCKTHFEQLFKETGSFSKKFTPGNIRRCNQSSQTVSLLYMENNLALFLFFVFGQPRWQILREGTGNHRKAIFMIAFFTTCLLYFISVYSVCNTNRNTSAVKGPKQAIFCILWHSG
jgi:hypothetical protein